MQLLGIPQTPNGERTIWKQKSPNLTMVKLLRRVTVAAIAVPANARARGRMPFGHVSYCHLQSWTRCSRLQFGEETFPLLQGGSMSEFRNAKHIAEMQIADTHGQDQGGAMWLQINAACNSVTGRSICDCNARWRNCN